MVLFRCAAEHRFDRVGCFDNGIAGRRIENRHNRHRIHIMRLTSDHKSNGLILATLIFAAQSAHAQSLPVEHVGERPASRSEEHTSELQSLMRISYAVFCLKKKKIEQQKSTSNTKKNE